jgi:hypothetical protein
MLVHQSGRTKPDLETYGIEAWLAVHEPNRARNSFRKSPFPEPISPHRHARRRPASRAASSVVTRGASFGIEITQLRFGPDEQHMRGIFPPEQVDHEAWRRLLNLMHRKTRH